MVKITYMSTESVVGIGHLKKYYADLISRVMGLSLEEISFNQVNFFGITNSVSNTIEVEVEGLDGANHAEIKELIEKDINEQVNEWQANTQAFFMPITFVFK